MLSVNNCYVFEVFARSIAAVSRVRIETP
jgi:hypothetical protein